MLRPFFLMLGLLSASVAMAKPVFSIVPEDTLPTVPGSTAFYNVTNNTPYVLRNNGLLPQKNIAQDTSSDCYCASPFTLSPGETCLLALDISGLTSGGPTVCNQAGLLSARCSTPNAHNQLNIKHRGVLGTNSPSYGLVQTVDGGANWEAVSFETDGFSSVACSDALCVAAGFAASLAETDNETPADWDVISLGTDATFQAASCTGEWCIAVGRHAGLPDIAQRDPVTQEWAFITRPDVWPGAGEFDGGSCSEDLCIAAGGDGLGNFFIAESTDQTWALTFTQSTDVNVSSASCVGTYCMVVGERYNSIESTINAVLYQRNPNTGVWTDISYDIEGLAAGTSNFEGASCSSSICIATGSVLAQSTDQGKHWSVINPALYGTLHRASCSGQFCIAVGRGPNNQAMVIQTTNAGKSWQVPNISGMPVVSESDFGPASCSGNFCVAGGSAEDGMTIKPIFAQTTDSGKHWAVVNSVALPKNISIFGAGSQ